MLFADEDVERGAWGWLYGKSQGWAVTVACVLAESEANSEAVFGRREVWTFIGLVGGSDGLGQGVLGAVGVSAVVAHQAACLLWTGACLLEMAGAVPGAADVHGLDVNGHR